MALEDSLILDIEVGPADAFDTRTRIKFVAMAGGCGPEVTMDRALAIRLLGKLRNYLAPMPGEKEQTNEADIEDRDRSGNAAGQEG